MDAYIGQPTRLQYVKLKYIIMSSNNNDAMYIAINNFCIQNSTPAKICRPKSNTSIKNDGVSGLGSKFNMPWDLLINCGIPKMKFYMRYTVMHVKKALYTACGRFHPFGNKQTVTETPIDAIPLCGSPWTSAVIARYNRYPFLSKCTQCFVRFHFDLPYLNAPSSCLFCIFHQESAWFKTAIRLPRTINCYIQHYGLNTCMSVQNSTCAQIQHMIIQMRWKWLMD